MPKNKYLLFLLSGFVLLVMVNFPWGKWLLGWDNLLPEFNFNVNIQRAIFSLWQENEGLGLIGGHGYAGTLLHSLTLLAASIAVPINYLRPLFTLTMLLGGSLGSFFLARILLKEKEEKIRSRISFIAGLFYMLNFATVQMFYIPLEAFCVHYAFLPWLLYFLILLFQNPNKKSFLLFTGISFLSSPQGFIPPLFLIYFLFLLIFCSSMILKKWNRSTIKLVGMVLLMTMLVNAYWLFPVGFYSLARSHIYLNSYNNQITTDDFVYKSKKYGSLDNLVTMKGLLYDAFDAKGTGNIFYIFQPWKDHLDNKFATAVFYFIFLVILLGVYESLRKGDIYKKTLVIFLLLSFTFLATDFFPLSYVSDILRNNIPILKQAFRIGFTKFSISLGLFYSLFLAFGLYYLLNRIDRFNNRYLNFIIFSGISALIIYLSFPAFQGFFFYNRIKLKFPEDYSRVFEFFNSQDRNSRVADFPQAVPTGWSIYNWDYTGSGFWWYGLNQPILDRNFDVWSNFNENYYWELSNAIYSNNSALFKNILRKYQVRWLLIDKNLISFVSQKAIYLDKLEQLISSLPEVNLINTFGKITLYQVNLDTNPQNYVFLAENLPRVGPEYKWNNLDKGYEEYGNYITNSSTADNNIDAYYPFRSLFTGRQQNELEFGVEKGSEYFSFKTKIPQELTGYKLVLPSISGKEITELDASDLDKITVKTPEIYLDKEFIPFTTSAASTVDLPYIKEGNLEIRVPKIGGYYSSEFETGSLTLEAKSCDQFNKGLYTHEQISEEGSPLLRLTSIGSSNCLDFDLPSLSQDIGYLVSVENRNIEGKSLLFSVINKNSQRADIETYLSAKALATAGLPTVTTSYFIIPPMEQYGLGYILHLDNISIGRVKTVNDLGKITVNPIPYRFLTGLKVVRNDSTLQGSTLEGGIKVDHPNPSLYQITLRQDSGQTYNNTTLVLSQSFDSGWHAYTIQNSESRIKNLLNKIFPFWTGKEINDHVLVNNWENGWDLNETMTQCSNAQCNIIIIYLPQYLEYIGFLLLGVAILVVIFYPKSKSDHQPLIIN